MFNSNKTSFKRAMAELQGELLLKEEQLKEIRTASINFITNQKRHLIMKFLNVHSIYIAFMYIYKKVDQ